MGNRIIAEKSAMGHRLVMLLGAAAVAIPAPGIVLAQQGAVLEEVVVTARKREESVYEIPESVSLIGGTEFERGQIARLEDIGTYIPNLNLAERGDGKPNVTIRGIGSFGNVQGIGFYLDGVQIFDDQQIRWGDLSRIEVLKGPQGTLYGGSNIGGAVKWETNRPDPQAFSARAEIGLGSYNTQDFEGHLNVPINENWAGRIFAYGSKNDGFLTNPVTTRITGSVNRPDPDIDRLSEKGVRLSLAGDLSDRLSVYAWGRWADLLGPMNVTQGEFSNDFEYSDIRRSSLTHQRDVESWQGTVQLDYKLDFATLTSITSYAEIDQFGISDVDLSHELSIEATQPERAETFTQELRITSTDGGPLEWQAGLYFLDRDFHRNFDLQLYPLFFLLDFRPIAPGDPRLPQTPAAENSFIEVPLEHRDEQRKSYAAFGTATYRFGDFELEGGLRVEQWEVETTNFAAGISGKQDSTEILPKASLTYFFDRDRSMIYGSFARGFHPGGFNLSNFAGTNTLFGFDNEESDNFEIGYKGRLLDDSVRLTLAGFYIDYKDRQFEVQVRDPVTNQFVEGIVSVGDSEHIGMEASIAWQATDYLNMMFSAGWGDGEWKGGTVLDDGTDLSGLETMNFPEYDLNGVINYDRPINANMDFWGRLQVSATGEQKVSLDNQFFIPSREVVNIAAGVRYNDRWELSVEVKNLFDEDYHTDAAPFPDFDPTRATEQFQLATRGNPRWIMVNLSVEY